MISSSIIGLVLLLGTYTLLQIVNPALLSFKPIETEYIGVLQYVCCEYEDKAGNNVAENITSVECTEKKGTKVPNASANSAKTDCLKNGCCIATYPKEVYSKIGIKIRTVAAYTCYTTNLEYCARLEQGNQSMAYDQATWNFEHEKCSKFDICTKDNQSTCDGKKDGKKCEGTVGNECHCYDEIAWPGEGLEGEPCGGGDPIGKCYKEKPNDTELITYTRNLRGRSCEGSLSCFSKIVN
jgi:hypothetical protein